MMQSADRPPDPAADARRRESVALREALQATQGAGWRGLALTAISGAISIMWLDWRIVAVWAAAVFLIGGFAGSAYCRRFVLPYVDSEPAKARRWLAGQNFVMTALFAGLWPFLWLDGSLAAAALGSLWLAGCLMVGVNAFARIPLCFVASAAPCVIGVLVLPFFFAENVWVGVGFVFGLMNWLWVMYVMVNERARLSNSLDTAEAARVAAEKASEAKSQFLAVMSHELRTPLNAVIGYAEILEEDLQAASNEGGADDARRIHRAARSLLTLINEVLDFSKIEAGRTELRPEDFDPRALIPEIVEGLRPLAEVNHNRLEVVIDPAVRPIVSDPARLQQCVTNLVSNACKFTQNGVVRVEVGMQEQAGRSQLVLTVRDTGIGIMPEDLDRLFQPFVQVDGTLTRRHTGTGLGLAITRSLAQLMGGDVHCESKPGEGSAFTLTIADLAAPALASANENDGLPIVLVIEDEPDARDIIERALARLPVQVRMAGTAREGRRAAEACNPVFVLLDIHLPDAKGWDVLASFKADPALAALPIMVVSIEDDRARATALGACDFMLKPIDRDRLCAAVLRYARLDSPAKAMVRQPPRDEHAARA
jgi:signal transduction histidine kinase/CheY-like chemotaxis protein